MHPAPAPDPSRAPAAGRLARQLDFLRDADRLKLVLRRTRLIDRSRHENSAEHSWHLALMALTLGEYAEPGTDLSRVIELLLVHDLVEIDAGDTFAYDVAANVGKEAREQAAADRLFGQLPADVGGRLRAAWDEFEAGATPEARFANALDRLQGLLLNDARGDGGTWTEYHVSRAAVERRMEPIRHASPALWAFAMDAVERADAAGQLG